MSVGCTSSPFGGLGNSWRNVGTPTNTPYPRCAWGLGPGVRSERHRRGARTGGCTHFRHSVGEH